MSFDAFRKWKEKAEANAFPRKVPLSEAYIAGLRRAAQICRDENLLGMPSGICADAIEREAEASRTDTP